MGQCPRCWALHCPLWSLLGWALQGGQGGCGQVWWWCGALADTEEQNGIPWPTPYHPILLSPSSCWASSKAPSLGFEGLRHTQRRGHYTQLGCTDQRMQMDIQRPITPILLSLYLLLQLPGNVGCGHKPPKLLRALTAHGEDTYRVIFFTGPAQKSSKYGTGPTQQWKND